MRSYLGLIVVWAIRYMLVNILATYPDTVAHKSKQGNLIIGINGHPLNQKDYLNIPVAKQIALLKQMGMTHYRFDVPIDDKGNIRNQKGFFKLSDVAKLNKIELLPMVYLMRLNFNDDEQTSYNKGYTIGATFASKYGKYLNYYELGNEEDLLITKTGTSGSDVENYDTGKLKILTAFWKGMIKAIKSIQPKAQIIINTAGWFHFIFFELLNRENVNYDIVGYHWYSDMDDYSKKVNIDISRTIAQRYHKPIWYTEINVANGTNKNSELKQELWVKNFIGECRAVPMVHAVFIYELLDEPLLENVPEYERCYGIVTQGKGDRRINNFKLLSKWLTKRTN